MRGNEIVAKSLAQQGLKFSFGIVGVPVIELGSALQGEEIQYYGCRNEQGASYSAGAVGYLTGKPGICLCVSGPGMIHGMAGVANAWSNNWPMILISGASDLSQDGKGSFQESDQLSLAKPYCKYAYKVTDPRHIPFHIEKAVRYSMQGRPGPVYIELPGDVLSATIDENEIFFPPKFEEIDIPYANPKKVQEAIQLLKSAKNPLIIIGKGSAYSRAEKEVLQFVEGTKIPFLATPMGKGVIDDDHPLSTGPARSTALGQADVILLLGARLNWILHFGLSPRFQKNVKIIQVDICAEEFNTNVYNTCNLYGNIKAVVDQLNQEAKNVSFPAYSEWKNTLEQKKQKNILASDELLNDLTPPLQYYSAFNIIKKHMPEKFIYVGEGANTMDIGRTVFSQKEPRTKLDAGTYGTMGIGIPFALASKVVHPDRNVVTIMGDSAFGFSAMELETAQRYNLPLIIFIINNNGIFTGVEELEADKSQEALQFPPTALKPNTHYEKMAEAFGGEGIFVNTADQLEKACQKVFANKLPDKLYIVNVMIDPNGVKKPQEHSWLTKSKM